MNPISPSAEKLDDLNQDGGRHVMNGGNPYEDDLEPEILPDSPAPQDDPCPQEPPSTTNLR